MSVVLGHIGAHLAYDKPCMYLALAGKPVFSIITIVIIVFTVIITVTIILLLL